MVIAEMVWRAYAMTGPNGHDLEVGEHYLERQGREQPCHFRLFYFFTCAGRHLRQHCRKWSIITGSCEIQPARQVITLYLVVRSAQL